jgi:preprotein translocase subunit SecA
MTGTAQTSAEEFDKVYKLEVVTIPTNREMIRMDSADVIYKNTEAKYVAITEDIKARQAKGQPVLIGTVSIEKNEALDKMLSRAGIVHETLNAKNHEREGAIIAQAGKAGAVTVATNMAGRGVDIILGGNPPNILEAQKIKEVGGLHVIGTDRHEARRIDNQLRGRAGRQGDPGSSQFFLSLEDDLMRVFGGDRLKNLMEKLDMPENVPIQSSMVSRAIGEAQSRVEGFNFDARKHLLEYDDVLNRQRLTIYKKRQGLLGSGSLKLEVGRPETEVLESKSEENIILSPQGLNMALGMFDMLWMTHLADMEALGEGVRLRAYGQHDPLAEYKREGHILFKQMLANFDDWAKENSDKLEVTSDQAVVEDKMARPVVSLNTKPYTLNPDFKVGRNDPCPCGSGKKYKKCHGD